ncbi:hypothetical protein GCM10009806_01460 [Microbacterium flavum]
MPGRHAAGSPVGVAVGEAPGSAGADPDGVVPAVALAVGRAEELLPLGDGCADSATQPVSASAIRAPEATVTGRRRRGRGLVMRFRIRGGAAPPRG